MTVCALLFAACYGWLLHTMDYVSDAERIQPTRERDFYSVGLNYDAGTRTLRGRQTLTAVNRTGEDMENMVLRLYMNGVNGGSAAVSGVTANGKGVTFAQDENDPTVLTINRTFAAGETVELGWTVMIKHPKTDGAAIITLPTLAMLEDGAWRTDAYDALAEPSYGAALDYEIAHMIVPNGVCAAFGGTLVGAVIDNSPVYTAQMRMARDISFALLNDGWEKHKDVSGVRVRALSQDSGTAKKLLEAAQAALESLREIGIDYPFDALTVADGDTARADGMVYSGLIALDADADKETLIRKLTRLIARQTFGILVENDPWNAPWLSETLASSAELLAYRARKGAAAYEERFYGEIELATRVTRPVGVGVGATTAHFGTDGEMTQVLRDQGAAMLLGVEQAVGEEAFLRALNLYIDRCAGKKGTMEALCAALEQATGSRWDGYISDMLAF